MDQLIEEIKKEDKIEISRQGHYRILKYKDNYFLLQINKEQGATFGMGEVLKPILLLEQKINLMEHLQFKGWDISENQELKKELSNNFQLDFVDQGNTNEIVPSQVWSKINSFLEMMMSWNYQEIHQEILEMIKQYQPKKILDVGCTKGDLLLKIKEQFPQIISKGLDLNQKCVEQCQEVNLDVSHGDAVEIKESFDFIIACGLLTEMVVNKQKAIEIAKSIYLNLESQGYSLITGFRSVLLNKKEFEEIGFRVLKTSNPQNFFNEKAPKEIYLLQKVV